ncbi:hypothetical protein LTR28_004426 [Elasticomyces elasticus]|nr:hypothetical protein LTR28_004426 [Elasticomyces elasticus]
MQDGWTQVTHKSRPKDSRTSTTQTREPPQIKDLTLAQIQRDYRGIRKQFEQSACWSKLRSLINLRRPERGWEIDTAVCLACSSVCFDWQLKVESPNMDIFAQEPRYQPLDHALLDSLGIRTLQDPEAERHITPKAFVFVAFLEWHRELDIVVDGKDSALYIGTGMDPVIEACGRILRSPHHEKKHSEGRDAKRLKEVATAFRDTHDRFDFPELEQTDALTGLSIHFRKQTEDRDDA